MGSSQASLIQSSKDCSKNEKVDYHFILTQAEIFIESWRLEKVHKKDEGAMIHVADYFKKNKISVCFKLDSAEQAELTEPSQYPYTTKVCEALEKKLKRGFQSRFSGYYSTIKVTVVGLRRNNGSYVTEKIKIDGTEVVAYCCYALLASRLDPLLGTNYDFRRISGQHNYADMNMNKECMKCIREGFAYDYWDRKDTRQTQMTKGKGIVTLENRQLSNREDYEDYEDINN